MVCSEHCVSCIDLKFLHFASFVDYVPISLCSLTLFVNSNVMSVMSCENILSECSK